MSAHALKTRFQALLRPLAERLAEKGTGASEITLLSITGSLVVGSSLLNYADHHWFVMLPVWLLLRAMMNAIAATLAREQGGASPVETYINEFGSLVSNAVLIAPFALVAPFDIPWIVAIVALSVLAEFAGALGPSVGASRRRDGPLAAGETAFVFGILGAWLGIAGALPERAYLLQPAICLALALTVLNRIRAGVREARAVMPADSEDLFEN